MSTEKKREEPGEIALFVHRFPASLRKKLRIASVTSGRLMREIFIEACTDWLKRHKNGGK